MILYFAPYGNTEKFPTMARDTTHVALLKGHGIQGWWHETAWRATGAGDMVLLGGWAPDMSSMVQTGSKGHVGLRISLSCREILLTRFFSLEKIMMNIHASIFHWSHGAFFASRSVFSRSLVLIQHPQRDWFHSCGYGSIINIPGKVHILCYRPDIHILTCPNAISAGFYEQVTSKQWLKESMGYERPNLFVVPVTAIL